MQQRPSVVIVLSGTKTPRGGLTSSALNRASRLAERGYDVHLCTFDYRPDFGDHVLDLMHQDILGRNVRFHNFFEDLRLRRSSVARDPEVEVLDASPLVMQKESNRLTRFFSPAGRFEYSELRGAGQSMWRRYYTDNRIEKRRVEYSVKGTLHRETLFVENSSVVSWISYLDDSGYAFFTQWMDAEGKPSDVFVAEGAGSSRRYSSLQRAQEDWFQFVVSDLDGPVVVMIDDCTMAPAVQKLKHKSSKRIAIFHNDHKTPAHKAMIEAMESWDAVVCSTQGQSEVLREVVPTSLSITVIGQAVQDRAVLQPRSPGVSCRFAFFGRLTSTKNIVPLVSAFASVIDSMPLATLDIYGSGPQEAELKELISELGLQNSVRLMGRTEEAPARMAEYNATIVPSSFEAFGLVVGESLLAQTPVIAFDCDFGPRDIIRHGIDGLLVDTNDFSKLADQIVYLGRHPEEAEKMGRAGRHNVLERFSNDAIMARWEELVKEVSES